MTRRIELFFSWIWLEELIHFFSKWPKGFYFFSSKWPKGLNTFFEYDRKNWTLRIRLKEWNLFKTWPKELNFFQCDSKSWIFFEHDSQNWTFFFLECDSKNWTLFFSQHHPKNWALQKNLTQRNEPDFQKFVSKNWTLFTKGLKELDFFQKKIFKELNFLNIFLTPRIKFFCDSRDGTFSIWIQELNPFFNYYSKMIDLFFFYMTHRIEPFFLTWLTELNPFLSHDSQNWTLFRKTWLIEIEHFFSTWVKGNESIFWVWLKE